MKHSTLWMVVLIVLFASIGCEGDDGTPSTPSNTTDPIKEQWSAMFDDDSGFTGHFTLEKTAQGQILAVGDWCRWCGAVGTYTGTATFSDSVLTVTVAGSATNENFIDAYRTSTYTLSIQGVIRSGSCEGTFLSQYASDYWQAVSAHIGNTFVAWRTSGNGVTD